MSAITARIVDINVLAGQPSLIFVDVCAASLAAAIRDGEL
jgi:hypothetical protein